jgi:hypothetical protein
MTVPGLTRALTPALAAAVGLALVPVAATAAPATDKTWNDRPETVTPAADIVSVRRVAAPPDGRWMRVIVRLADRIEAGDSLEVHFDTDNDREPDVWITGLASSEYEVYDTDRWRDTSDPIGALDCARMRFALGERRGVVRFDPTCVEDDPVKAVRVNVRTSFLDKPHRRDFAPARREWLSRTAAHAAQ